MWCKCTRCPREHTNDTDFNHADAVCDNCMAYQYEEDRDNAAKLLQRWIEWLNRSGDVDSVVEDTTKWLADNGYESTQV